MPVRGLIFHSDFVHRANENGTVDSICLYCYCTAASLPNEADLEGRETAHACWRKAQQTNVSKLGNVARFPSPSDSPKPHALLISVSEKLVEEKKEEPKPCHAGEMHLNKIRCRHRGRYAEICWRFFRGKHSW
jgi:hypothetical protein